MPVPRTGSCVILSSDLLKPLFRTLCGSPAPAGKAQDFWACDVMSWGDCTWFFSPLLQCLQPHFAVLQSHQLCFVPELPLNTLLPRYTHEIYPSPPDENIPGFGLNLLMCSVLLQCGLSPLAQLLNRYNHDIKRYLNRQIVVFAELINNKPRPTLEILKIE